MKINPPLAVLALICCSLAALAVNQAKQNQKRHAQCQVALAFLQSLERYPSKPLLVIELPEEVLSMEELKLGLAQNPSWKDDPDFKIEIEKSKTAHLSPVKICSNVRKWAAANGVRIESRDIQNASPATLDWLTLNKDGQYDWHIVSLSMPVLSDDGQRANLNSSEYVGPLGGGGEALEYHKKLNGSWILARRDMRYIS